MRIAKFMAQSGLCSRRDAEKWILAGRVQVNGQTLSAPGITVTAQDQVKVDGCVIAQTQTPQLWLYHKPARLLTTHSDPQGRETVFEMLPPGLPRVISVGRLDMFSEGLLLLTTSGALARTLELPRTRLNRVYHVCVRGDVTAPQQQAINAGITIDGVAYHNVHVETQKALPHKTWLIFTLQEGKNREIRRIAEFMGWVILTLKRTSYGPFQLGDLPVGGVREVNIQHFQRFLDA